MTHHDHRNGFEFEAQAEPAAGSGLQQVLELLAEHGFEGMAQAMQVLFNEAMKLERSQVLGAAPYQRTTERRGHANGFKPKTVETRLGRLELAVPQTRGVAFYPSSLERGSRSERALKLAVAEMYLQGVSTRKVTAVMEQLCGSEVTSMQVSRVVQALDEELGKWRERTLGKMPYLLLDARYEKVRINGTVVSCALLIAIGVSPDGQRTILGVSVSLSEAEVHWREFLASLQARGLHGVQLITSDDHAGLRAALNARCAGTKWQRCQFHLAKNLLDHLPPNVSQEEASADLRAVFNAPNRAEADRLLGLMASKHASTAKKLTAWLEQNVPEGLSPCSTSRASIADACGPITAWSG
jgi:transposase-like protein